MLSVDTIVNLPTSVSGYKHVGQVSCVQTNYGALWMRKTKSMSDELLFWLKLVLNTTGHHPALLKMDNGEYKTKLVAEYCESNGIEISVATADTMGNMPVERRNRTLEEAARSLMNQGGAGSHMWEFAYPYANMVLNLTISLKTLREVGRPHKSKQRPLTPFERFVNGGVQCNIEAMWSSMHHLFSAGYGYQEVKQGHENRGVPIISLGPGAQEGEY